MRAVASVSAATFRSSRGISGQLGQEEPVAAPGHVARHLAEPRHLDHHVARVAEGGHVLDGDRAVRLERAPTVPTGVSILTGPGRRRPRCSSVRTTPIVPWPHIPSPPALLKNTTPAAEPGSTGG
jgi:hypothetical protein